MCVCVYACIYAYTHVYIKSKLSFFMLSPTKRDYILFSSMHRTFMDIDHLLYKLNRIFNTINPKR